MQYIFMVLYVVVLVIISIIYRHKTKSMDDFFLGGRNLGAWLSAFAYGTTYFSAVIFIGYAGKIGWGFGISATLIGIGNALIGSLVAWLLLAKPTRRFTHKFNISTMPEFFEKRYGSKRMKIISAIIIFVFLVPYCASVYQGLSYLFEQAFNIPFEYCIIGIAVLTGFYLFIGGYFATAVVDLFQGVIMIVGVVLMLIFILANPSVGGLQQGVQKLADIDPMLASLKGAGGIVPLLSLIFLTSVGIMGLPQMIHKFYAIKDDKAVKRGTVISTLFAVLIGGGAYFTGAFGRLFLNNELPIDPSTGLANPDMVMPQVLMTALPEVLLGVIVILVLSASMSTLSSLVLVSSSAISIDLVKGHIKPDISQKSSVAIMRGLCVLFIIISLAVALNKITAIVTLMSFSWGTVAGSFLAPYLYGLYWKGVTRAGAWAGMACGIVVTLTLMLIMGLEAAMAQAPMIGSLAMIASLIAVPVVSLLTPKTKYSEEHIAEVFAK